MQATNEFDPDLALRFLDFKLTVADGLLSGEIHVSAPLSDLAMAVQFACGLLWDEGKRTMSGSEICEKVLTFADRGIFDRNDGWYMDELNVLGDGDTPPDAEEE